MKPKFGSDDYRRIAALTGVNEKYLYQCLTGRRDMKPSEAVRVEKVTLSEVSRFDLCQNNGQAIWPELVATLPTQPPQQPPQRAATAEA